MVNKEFNLEDISVGTGNGKAKGDRKSLVIDGKYENKTLWSYSDALKTDRAQTQSDPFNPTT